MPTALIINPNTSTSVTDLMLDRARALLPAEWTLRASTARFGAGYISSEVAYAIAGHAVLDSYAAEGEGVDAVLVGCFGDPGLHALTEIVPVPVIGLAEASMREAARAGRFSIVTGGERWAPILRRLAAGLGLEENLAGIHFVTQSGVELAADPERALDVLAEKCEEAMRQDAPRSIILGGAALAGMGEKLAERLGLPVIDSVSAGMRALRDRLGSVTNAAGLDGARYGGLGAQLTALLSP